MVHVGEQVKRLREERGWSQPRLAVEAGVAVSAVSQIENGRRSPNVSTLDKLANAFGVVVTDLFPKGRRSSREPRLFNGDERLEKPIDLAIEAAEKRAIADRQAIARAASSGRPQGSMVQYENEAMRRLLEYPHGDVSQALVDLARRHVQLEQENAQLREAQREWETEKA